MPVMNSSGELAVYATVDLSKKTKHKVQMEEEVPESAENKENEEEPAATNYANVEPGGVEVKNYVNLEFAHSLEYYENARDVLNRAGLGGDVSFRVDNEGVKYCKKCGHACQQKEAKGPQDDYLLMEPAALEVKFVYFL